MNQFKSRLQIKLKKLYHIRRKVNSPRRFVHKEVPYFSQWESPDLNQAILSRQIDAKDDPNWRQSGAKTKQEYFDWSWSGCGMACLKMTLAYLGKGTIPLVTLGKRCAKRGGYTYPLESSSGLLYKPFVKFVKKEFGLDAKVINPMLLEDIIILLGSGGFVIASVTPEIRQPNIKPKLKGGHLVLMLGYDLDKAELYFHNPSGISKSTRDYASISLDNFKNFFNNRGIVIND